MNLTILERHVAPEFLARALAPSIFVDGILYIENNCGIRAAWKQNYFTDPPHLWHRIDSWVKRYRHRRTYAAPHRSWMAA